MADAVATNTLFSQEHRRIVQFTNISDGTGESDVVKIDRSALDAGTTPIRIRRIWATAVGMSVRLEWDATADSLILHVLDGNPYFFDFSDFNFDDPQASGFTGDVLFTTIGHTSGDSYSIIIDYIW